MFFVNFIFLLEKLFREHKLQMTVAAKSIESESLNHRMKLNLWVKMISKERLVISRNNFFKKIEEKSRKQICL